MLIELLIAQACAQTIGQDHTACVKAFEALGVQTNVSRDIASAEQKIGLEAYRTVEQVTGQTALGVIGLTAKIAREKSLTIPVNRQDGALPSIQSTFGINGGTLNINWRF